ncbi:hypothetical protein [Luteibacter sp.]|uniref:hypothetical protein n=1 Tax=Luteibacter sp. TaxID=1886636 RepID=UPI0025C3E004|nr:hypothetical protein [Luteibacter sp.]
MLADPDAVRADILRLHAMTHALLNGGPLSVASTPAAVGEVATEVGMALDHWMALLTCMRRGLQPLEALVQDATD